jgi:hypothetical protein
MWSLTVPLQSYTGFEFKMDGSKVLRLVLVTKKETLALSFEDKESAVQFLVALNWTTSLVLRDS